MNEPRVLLATLAVRTSKHGRPYVTGWLGKSRLIGFPGQPDRYGNETIDLYLQQAPEERAERRDLTVVNGA